MITLMAEEERDIYIPEAFVDAGHVDQEDPTKEQC